MQQRETEIAGLSTVVVEPATAPCVIVVVLHGYAMGHTDLVPFAHSMGLPALFLFPRGTHAVEPSGRSWWPIDAEARMAALQQGPRDLFDEYPRGRDAARLRLRDFVAEVRKSNPQVPVVLAGFSQGGMLACEAVLHGMVDVDGLALMSASRLAWREWQALASRVRDLPILVSHGELDTDLAYTAGEQLRDWLSEASATVTWVPFATGHEIPLTVWRQLRRFLAAIGRQGPARAG